MAQPPVPTPGAGLGADPSMDEILASIRRILNEDEVKPAAPASVPGPAPAALTVPAPATPAPATPVPAPHHIEVRVDDVLVLDETMMVPPEAPAEPAPAPAVLALPPPDAPAPGAALTLSQAGPDPAAPAPVIPMPSPHPAPPIPVHETPMPNFTPIAVPQSAPADPAPPSASIVETGQALVSPAAAGAAGAAVEALVRTLARERQTATHRGGPTIEDLVREEVRPLLTQWLDTHLPPLVERLVRAEIERVMGRIAP